MELTTLAAANFARWDNALRTRDAKVVTDLYARNATLLPTLGQTIMTDRAGIEKYFTFFCGFSPIVNMQEEYFESLSDDSYHHAGVYRFMLGPENERTARAARFSLIWKKNDAGIWEILHHHSSAVPSGPGTTA